MKSLKYSEVANKINAIKEQNKSVGLVGGHFDLLHLGHLKFLNECRKRCDCFFLCSQ